MRGLAERGAVDMIQWHDVWCLPVLLCGALMGPTDMTRCLALLAISAWLLVWPLDAWRHV